MALALGAAEWVHSPQSDFSSDGIPVTQAKGQRDMAQLVKGLLVKHEDLSFDTQHPL